MKFYVCSNVPVNSLFVFILMIIWCTLILIHLSLCEIAITSNRPLTVQYDGTSAGSLWQTSSDSIYILPDGLRAPDDSIWVYSSIPYFSYSAPLILSRWNFTIPAGSTVTGIEVSIYRRGTGDGG